MRILIILLAVALPFQAAANIDCTVIEALERVQLAQTRLAQTGTIDTTSPDALLIIRETGRLDSDKITFAGKSTLNTVDLTRLLSFFEASADLRVSLRANRPEFARNLLDAPAFAQHLTNAKRILPQFNCNTVTGMRGIDGSEKASSTVGQTKPAQKLTIAKAGFWLVGLIMAGAGAFQLNITLTALQTRKKRRAKRYSVHISTHIQNGDTQRQGTILDISCNGLKFKTETNEIDIIGAEVKIWIDGKWRTAHITWANVHYLGVRFAHALPHVYVSSLNHSAQVRAGTNKNGAQLGAAFDK